MNTFVESMLTFKKGRAGQAVLLYLYTMLWISIGIEGEVEQTSNDVELAVDSVLQRGRQINERPTMMPLK